MARRKTRPGPKAELKNPFPADGHNTKWISAEMLDHDERRLRAHFRGRRGHLRRRRAEAADDAVRRITELVTEALDAVGAAWWSELYHVTVEAAVLPSRFTGFNSVRRHVGATPPKKPAFGCLWLDTSQNSRVVRRLHPRTRTWDVVLALDETIKHARHRDFLDDLARPVKVTTSWRLNIDEAIRRMLSGQTGRAGRNGRPTFLACAALGALLAQPPEKVFDLLLNHRRRRGSRAIHT